MNYPVLVWWLALAVCVPSVVLSTSTSHHETNVEDYGITWIFMPDENGNPYVVYLDEDISNEPLVIQVELYNRNNRFRDKGARTKFVVYQETIFQNDTATLKVINDFDARLDTKMVTHGFRSNSNASVVQSIRDNYIARGNLNIFAIDWNKRANQYLMDYEIAANYVPEVGQAIGWLINFLVDNKKADSKRIHLIGHSLGAHVMGIAGYNFTSISGKTIGRITGLDPAGPRFENYPDKTHLNTTHADFVDVIHTDSRSNALWNYGFTQPIGHVDFYPNGESTLQPNCKIMRGWYDWFNPNKWKEYVHNSTWLLGWSVSHSRAYELYAESINSTTGFYSVPCANLDAAFTGNCSGSQILMGDPVPVKARGIYYLKTNKKFPYAKGKYVPVVK